MPELKPSCTTRNQIVTRADLPLCCPTKDTALWNAHPRVYLPIEETGEITCPYCSMHFTLQQSSTPSAAE